MRESVNLLFLSELQVEGTIVAITVVGPHVVLAVLPELFTI